MDWLLGRYFSTKSPGRSTEDLGLKSALLSMHEDRWWEFGAVNTKCSEFITNAAIAKWRVNGKNDGCWKGEVPAYG